MSRAAASAAAHDLVLRVEDVLASARRHLLWIAAALALELTGGGALAGWLWDAPVAGAAIGGGAGMAAVLILQDLAKRLDNPPRGLNLVRARLAVAVLLVVAPLAFLWVRALARTLRTPALVSHAVANHPDFGRRPPELVVATIQVRSAYVLLRNASVLLGLGVALLWVAWLANFEYGGSLWWLMGLTVALTLVTAVQGVIGVLGVAGLKELEPAAVARVRRLSLVLWPMFPFGTYAAWSTRRAFGEL